MTAKKPRRKPVDRRQLPEVRAQLEVLQQRGISYPEAAAHMVFWDCSADWDKAAAWFDSPKVKPNIERYEAMRTYLFNADNQALFEEIYRDQWELYIQYSIYSVDA